MGSLGAELKFWVPRIFSVGNLQLSIGKLQLPARLTFFNPRRRWWEVFDECKMAPNGCWPENKPTDYWDRALTIWLICTYLLTQIGQKAALICSVSEKKTPFFIFEISLADVIQFCELLAETYILQEIWIKHACTAHHISFYMFALYLVKTSFASERTLRRWSLPVRLVIEPESRNFFIELFKLLTFQPVSGNLRITCFSPKPINLYKFSIEMRSSTVPLMRDLVCRSTPLTRQ